MPADSRGGWFRVYSRQVLQHPKFKDLSHAELGAWLDIRAAVDLMDGQPLADRTEALLRLRRRTKKPGLLLDALIAVELLDELEDGGIAIHDLADHDRRYPSDAPEAVKKRVTKHRQKRNDVTQNDGNEDVTEPRAREQTRAESDTESEADTETAAALLGLETSDDPLTVICSLLMTSGPIEDKEFRAKVDDQTRRYGKEWVVAAYRQAYADIVAAGNRPRQWDMRKLAEVHVAAWTRAEELGKIEAQHAAEEAERAARQAEAVDLTPEERERQELTRKAVGIWIRGGRKGEVPQDIEGLREWIEANQVAA